MRLKLLALLALIASLLSGCGYNQIQTTDEQVNAAWSEVLNQYKRRADLIPNLVSVVQGFAAQENPHCWLKWLTGWGQTGSIMSTLRMTDSWVLRRTTPTIYTGYYWKFSGNERFSLSMKCKT